MNTEQVVRALHVLCGYDGKSCDGVCSNCPADQFRKNHPSGACDDGTMSAAFVLIESLQTQLAESQRREREEGCEECTGILYRQTKSKKIVPLDKECYAAIPPCYQPDGDGCAYQIYGDNNDEPIEKCKECPLCNVDKVRAQAEREKGCGYCNGEGEVSFTYHPTGVDYGIQAAARYCPMCGRKLHDEHWDFEDEEKGN